MRPLTRTQVLDYFFYMGKKKNGLILLIEDDHDIRVAIRASLEEANYEVLSAPNGKTALEILKQYTPDLIVLDMIMPIMDGEEFLEQKNKSSKLAEIPVILISAFEDKVKVITDGSHQKKPFDMEKFLSTITSKIGKKMSMT